MSGPGTELKQLLSFLGFDPSSNCLCESRSLAMDANGCEWCSKNIELIVDWLEEEAERQKIKLFTRWAARHLIRRAIHLSQHRG